MLKEQQEKAAGVPAVALAPRADHELRTGRVCRLPDGSEVVVGVMCAAGRCFLYQPWVWLGGGSIIEMPIAYEVSPGGAVLTGRGEPTPWRAEDIKGTGEFLTRAARGHAH